MRLVGKSAVAAIRLMILTGARRGEILGLRWEWIDWQAAHVSLPDSKTGKKRILLNPAALAILDGLNTPGNGKGYVIRGGAGNNPETPLVNIKDSWGAIRQVAGLQDVRIHDLRHSFASVMVSAGMSLPMIGALLGHTDAKTTQRYAHLAADPLRAAADKGGSAIAGHLNAGNGGAEVITMRRRGYCRRAQTCRSGCTDIGRGKTGSGEPGQQWPAPLECAPIKQGGAARPWCEVRSRKIAPRPSPSLSACREGRFARPFGPILPRLAV